MYEASAAAGAKLDLNGMFAYCDPKCEFIGLRSQTDDVRKVRYQFHILNLSGVFSSIDCTTKIQSVAMQGSGATVVVKEHLVVHGGVPEAHLTIDETDDYTCQDYWIKTAAGWRELRTKLLSGKTYDDGQLDTFPADDHW